MTKLIIRQGETLVDVVRWAVAPFIYKAITGITQAAPAVITAVGHGLTAGWPVSVVSAKGMREINAQNSPPISSEYHPATIIGADSISLNDVNSADYHAYTSGGYLQFLTPHDLASYTARMSIKDRIGGTELLSLTTENGRIALDNTNKTITRTLSATDTAALTFTHAVYDLELVSAGGVVTRVESGAVLVEQEITN